MSKELKIRVKPIKLGPDERISAIIPREGAKGVGTFLEVRITRNPLQDGERVIFLYWNQLPMSVATGLLPILKLAYDKVLDALPITQSESNKDDMLRM